MIEKVNLRDSYRFYKNNSENPVDIRIYLYILSGFMQFIAKKILDGFYVELSGGKSFGTLGIRGRKQKVLVDGEGNIKGAAVNWKATNELRASNPEAMANKEKIYFLNEHTNGYRYKVVWFQEGMKVTNKSLFYFKLSKPNKRRATALFKSGKEYLTI
jgi:hypothetical protein